MNSGESFICSTCQSIGGLCCEKYKISLKTVNSFARVIDRQSSTLKFQARKIDEIVAAAPDVERLRIRYCLTDAGLKITNIGAPGSIANEAQDDVAKLIYALWCIKEIARRKPS